MIEKTSVVVLGRRRSNVAVRAAVYARHLSRLSRPVVLRVLKDAQTIDPDVCNLKSNDDLYRILNCPWESTELDIRPIGTLITTVQRESLVGRGPAVREGTLLSRR